jgi:class 3 adenylate cyclase
MLRYLTGLRFFPVAATLAGGIFLIDTLTSLQFAVASLYVIVVLIAAHDLHRRGVVITGVTCAVFTVFSSVLVHGFVVDGTAPLRSAVSLVSILITTILVLRNVSANQRVKKVEREWANLARFFSPKIVDQLVGIHTPFSFVRRQAATVLFADMIGFTAYSSGKPPDVVISMLRDLLHFLSEAVFSNQGSVDKYLGDGLMAFFGPAPDEPARCHKRGYVCPGNREIDRMLEPAARPLHRECCPHRRWHSLRRGRAGKCWQRKTARTHVGRGHRASPIKLGPAQAPGHALGAKHCATREATSVPTGMPTGFLNGRRYLTSSDFRTYGRSSLKIAKCRGARRSNTRSS